MENLVGRKVLCTQSYDGVTKGKEYTITNVDNSGFYIVEDDGRKQNWCISHLYSRYHLKLLPKETQFKQGDKVLYTDDLEFWHEGIFLTKYDDSYIIDSDKMLLYAIKIKPYEDEIKVGDWVFLNDEKGVCKITDKHDLKEVNNKFSLVKNIELIKLLNTELLEL